MFSLITYNYICKIHPPTQQCGRSLFRAMECWLATGFPKWVSKLMGMNIFWVPGAYFQIASEKVTPLYVITGNAWKYELKSAFSRNTTFFKKKIC